MHHLRIEEISKKEKERRAFCEGPSYRKFGDKKTQKKKWFELRNREGKKPFKKDKLTSIVESQGTWLVIAVVRRPSIRTNKMTSVSANLRKLP